MYAHYSSGTLSWMNNNDSVSLSCRKGILKGHRCLERYFAGKSIIWGYWIILSTGKPKNVLKDDLSTSNVNLDYWNVFLVDSALGLFLREELRALLIRMIMHQSNTSVINGEFLFFINNSIQHSCTNVLCCHQAFS